MSLEQLHSSDTYEIYVHNGSDMSRNRLSSSYLDPPVFPFTELGIDPAPPTSPAMNPASRIDFVWLRGLSIIRAWVSESLASDHRMVAVDIGLP